MTMLKSIFSLPVLIPGLLNFIPPFGYRRDKQKIFFNIRSLSRVTVWVQWNSTRVNQKVTRSFTRDSTPLLSSFARPLPARSLD
jgi:hypothetical protein